MKLSVSLTERDVATVDRYLAESGLESRSAVVQYAIGLLRDSRLEAAYEAAWGEWRDDGEEAAWAATTADGLPDASR